MSIKATFGDSFFSEKQTSNDTYTDYHIKIAYITDYGLIQLPVADSPIAAGDDCVLVQTHKPIQKKIVTWWAERLGDWPDVPAPHLFDQNSKLLHHDLHTPAPQPKTDGSGYIFFLAGVYIYAQKKVVSGNYPVAGLPVTKTPADMFEVKEGSFKTDIMGSIGGAVLGGDIGNQFGGG